jgi:hypothetical protein
MLTSDIRCPDTPMIGLSSRLPVLDDHLHDDQFSGVADINS